MDALKIKNYNIKRKFLRNGVGFTLVLLFLFFISFNIIKNWHDKTITKNSTLCNATARQLLLISKDKIESFAKMSYFSSNDISSVHFTNLDTSLAKITEKLMVEHEGLEGGYYFNKPDKFAGYSYPTSKPPKPVYGPPPRSYNIIREQCLISITEEKSLLQLHGFDPAVFPLMTVPLKFQNKIIGVIWVRIHIEKELPLIKLQNVVNITVLVLIASLIFVLCFFYKLRINIQSIQDELSKIHKNPDYRLQNHGKLFNEIVCSINQTLEALQSENQHRRRLKNQLHQKEKMASIGRIVAGVAHEVRTPLAIIKTRVQIWQQLLKEQKHSNTKSEFITEDALEHVVNETNRLSNLIKRFLVFSKPINKKMLSTDIPEQLKQVVKILQIQKENSEIEFVFNNDIVPNIEVDKNSMHQVFVNIISNSMEAMPNGGIITINTKVSNKNSKLKIDIIDKGVGIPNHIFDKMFELFVTSKSSGVGLGLSISYEIVKAHGGDIVFENLKQGGVKCTIILPIKQQ